MPYTATSLGYWMKQYHPRELSCTVGSSPVRHHHGSPRGCSSRLKGQYALRYGEVTTEAHLDGTAEERLRVGLITDGTAMFVFNPLWAQRLPVLCVEKDIKDKLETLAPGDTACPRFYIGRASSMPILYKADNDDMDFWYGSSCCEPSPIWAPYVVTDELREVNGVLWRKLYSQLVNGLKTTGKMFFGVFPEERLATAGDFPSVVYVREDTLHVLGDSQSEWNDVNRFYIFRPSSNHIVAIDRRCNVIVAEFSGAIMKP